MTYAGESGGEFVATIPVFSRFICTSDALPGPCTQLPDFELMKTNNKSKGYL